MEPLEKNDRIVMLENWREACLEIGRCMESLKGSVGADPESPLFTAIHALQEGYGKALGILLGDGWDWLEYYAFECDYGRKAQEVKYSDGVVVVLDEDVAKLLSVMEAVA